MPRLQTAGDIAQHLTATNRDAMDDIAKWNVPKGTVQSADGLTLTFPDGSAVTVTVAVVEEDDGDPIPETWHGR